MHAFVKIIKRLFQLLSHYFSNYFPITNPIPLFHPEYCNIGNKLRVRVTPAIIKTKKAEQALLECKPISDRIIYADFLLQICDAIDHTSLCTNDRIKQNYMDKYRCKDKEVKKSMRQDKRKWVNHLAAEEAAHNGKMKEVYDITKTLSNDKRKTTNAVKDKCGNLITEGLARRERWKEHFEEILNRSIPDDPVTDVEIDLIINEIGTDPITKAEIRTVLRKMKNGKAGGKDEITAELLKANMNTTEKWLVKLFRTFWEQEKVPKTWKQGLIIEIPKKDEFTVCGNWRGIL